jgi:hypothetical protein
MALQTTGPISLSQIQTEFGGSNPISLKEYYRDGDYVGSGAPGVPFSGQIKMSQFYGARNALPLNILITNSALDYNLRNAALSTGVWDGIVPLALTVTIGPCVNIWASSTSTYAFTIPDSLPLGTTVSLYINGGIIAGKGGNGGAGGTTNHHDGYNGENGGPALLVQRPTTLFITNNGKIMGGVGGGGGGAGFYFNQYYGVIAGGGGGGGGFTSSVGGSGGAGSRVGYGAAGTRRDGTNGSNSSFSCLQGNTPVITQGSGGLGGDYNNYNYSHFCGGAGGSAGLDGNYAYTIDNNKISTDFSALPGMAGIQGYAITGFQYISQSSIGITQNVSGPTLY